MLLCELREREELKRKLLLAQLRNVTTQYLLCASRLIGNPISWS